MKAVFADTAYWVARIDPADQHREAALKAKASLGRARLVTTEEVLVEVFSLVSRAPERVRKAAVRRLQWCRSRTNPFWRG